MKRHMKVKVAVSLQAENDLSREISRRTSELSDPGAVASRDLARYYRLLERARERLRGRFSPLELEALAWALQGPAVMGQVSPYIGADLLVLASLQDSARHGELSQIQGLDLEALEAKARALDSLEALALLDAMEIYWASSPEPGERAGKWRELGLLPPGEEDERTL